MTTRKTSSNLNVLLKGGVNQNTEPIKHILSQAKSKCHLQRAQAERQIAR